MAIQTTTKKAPLYGTNPILNAVPAKTAFVNTATKPTTPAVPVSKPMGNPSTYSQPAVNISRLLGGQSSATPMTPTATPKQQFASSLGTTASPTTQSSNAPDYSSLLSGLGNLRDSLSKPVQPSAPATTTAPKTDYYDKTRSAMDAYIQSLMPSDREKQLQTSYDNLSASTRAGVSRQEEDAIPMNFITGRQQSIENRGRELTDPIQAELSRLSSDRQSLSAGEKARYEFEANLAKENSANARDDARYNNGELQKAGDDIIRIKPDGTSEVVYKGTPGVETQVVQAGGQNILIDSKTGKTIASLGATEGALTRSTEAASGDGQGGGVSSDAQEIINQINLGGNLDELVKGTSIPAMKLRNEVIRGLNAQGGLSNKTTGILTDGKSIVDSMLEDKSYESLGGYSSRLGGQYTTAYGDASAQAKQLSAILARDNLGLLKGAMSDKDIEFINAMSSGFEGSGIQSESYIKDRLEDIQTKLNNKLAGTSSSSNLPKTRVVNGTTYTLQADGTYE